MRGLTDPGAVIRLHGRFRSYMEPSSETDYVDIDLRKDVTVVTVAVGYEHGGEEMPDPLEALLRVALPGWIDPAEFAAWAEDKRLAYSRSLGTD